MSADRVGASAVLTSVEYDGLRRDLKAHRDDVIDGLEKVSQDMHAGLERNAGHTLAVYRIVDDRLRAQGDESRAHRAEFVTFAAETREYHAHTKSLLEQLLKGERITSPQLDSIALGVLPIFSFDALALRLRVPRATLRLVLVAVLVTAIIVSTLTACVVHAQEIIR